jgi:hypothetical protein
LEFSSKALNMELRIGNLSYATLISKGKFLGLRKVYLPPMSNLIETRYNSQEGINCKFHAQCNSMFLEI